MTNASALMDQQLKRLIDREAIRDLMAEYTRALRDQDWPGVRSCFTLGARADYGEIGSGSIDDVLEIIQGLSDRLTDFVALGQDRIQIDGDRATSEFRAVTSHWPLNREDEARVGMWFLMYIDELERQQDGTWEIASRRIEVDWRGSLRRE
jgi:hypothetical protein